MREILFRGKPTERFKDFLLIRKEYDKSGFVHGSLVIDGLGRTYICFGGMCTHNSIINNGITTMVEVIPETVGQFTGLLDKNGKKIFEGDIVKTEFGRLCTVVWFSSRAFCGWDLATIKTVENCVHTKPPTSVNLFKSDCLKIVGNIHDNPELMGKKEKE